MTNKYATYHTVGPAWSIDKEYVFNELGKNKNNLEYTDLKLKKLSEEIELLQKSDYRKNIILSVGLFLVILILFIILVFN